MATTTTATDPAAGRSRRGGRWLTAIGLVLILAGAGILAYVGWQLYGTSYVAQRKHAAIADSIQREWSKPGRAGKRTVETEAGRARYVVRIPAFGRDYVVPILDGTSPEVLAEGFGHFDDAVAAGRIGNFALAGHRITHGEPLRNMAELEAGDRVIIETRDAIHTYVLDTGGDDLTVDFTQTWVLDPVPANPDSDGVQPPSQRPGQRLITLTTCSELFATNSRWIAFGHLEKTVRRT